jgi:hypothetical protein
MARKYRNYTDEQVVQKCKEVNSMAELLKALDLRIAGGNYNNMRKTLQRLNLDCSHWTGSAWNTGQRLKDWSEYNKLSSLKPHLIKERGHQCEKCKITEWQGNPIPLEVEHSNGDRTDNRKENLELLCCNCHALTPTWRGRNAKIRSP